MGTKWVTGFFWIFYLALIILTAAGLYLTGIKNIQAAIFYFVLLGLFSLPFLVNLFPSLESINVFGFELKIRKELEETRKIIQDVDENSKDYIKKMIFTFVNEESLTNEGKEEFEELRQKRDEI